MVLKEIHTIIEFKRLVGNHNSELRQKATNGFKKYFCELKKKKIKIRQVHNSSADQVDVLLCISLSWVETYNRIVELNKSIYIGATVLNVSKLLIYKFHYQTMKNQ